jgi:hypothetical protein
VARVYAKPQKLQRTAAHLGWSGVEWAEQHLARGRARRIVPEAYHM